MGDVVLPERDIVRAAASKDDVGVAMPDDGVDGVYKLQGVGKRMGDMGGVGNGVDHT
jgi:hypothetical protein